MLKLRIIAAIWLSLTLGSFAPVFSAPYDSIIQVNDQVITEFELEQRELLLGFLGATGNQKRIAEEQLIEDRLKLSAAKRQGVEITSDQIFAGIEQFAARGEISGAELVSIAETRGIYRETIEDFVRVNLAWNEVLSARFGFRGFLSEQEIDTELAVGTANQEGIELLLAEIILPYQSRGEEGAKELAETIRSEILRGESTFAVSAAQYSETPTAANGGVREWVALSQLSNNIYGPLVGGGVGSLSEPIELGNAIGVFQLRGIRTNASNVTPTTIEFMTLPLAATSEATIPFNPSELLETVDTCNDLRAISNDIQPNLYSLSSVLERAAGAQYAAVLTDLDVNEAKTIQRANGVEIVMVCSRQRDLQEDARARLRNILGDRRVDSFGDAYLNELQGNAVIVRN